MMSYHTKFYISKNSSIITSLEVAYVVISRIHMYLTINNHDRNLQGQEYFIVPSCYSNIRFFLIFFVIALASLLIIQIPSCKSESLSDAIKVEFEDSIIKFNTFPLINPVIFNGSAWIENVSGEHNITNPLLSLSLQSSLPWKYWIVPEVFLITENPTPFFIRFQIQENTQAGTHHIEILGVLITNQTDYRVSKSRSIYLNITKTENWYRGHLQ